jgi:uncharacterized protein
MILYIDTSALVKSYVKETSSDNVVDLIENAETVGSSVLAKVEMASALEKGVRQKWVARTNALKAWNDFLEDWPSFTRLIVSAGTIDRASALAWEYSLRGYDAMHLACGLLWQETLGIQITIATYDRELWRASNKAGLTAWPASLLS